MSSIAVLIVTWNSIAVIEQAIISLGNQIRQPNKILIIDNNSNDINALTLIVNKYSFCELILLEANTGFASANNNGIQRLKNFDFIALLNPDAFPKNDWLLNLEQAALLHPTYGSFASLQLQENAEYVDGAGDCLSISGQPFRRHYAKKLTSLHLSRQPVFSACAAAALYKTSALLTAKGFDEDFFCYVEDVDLGFRLQLLGYPCLFIPEAVVIHIGSTSTGKRSDFSVYFGQRNLVYNFFKNIPTPLLFLLLIPHVLSLFMFIGFGFLIGKGKVICKAKMDAYKNLSIFYLKRKEIQNKRKVRSLYILKLLSLMKH